MTPDDTHKEEARIVRKRQRARAAVMAVLLGAFVLLMFGITIAKIKAGMQ